MRHALWNSLAGRLYLAVAACSLLVLASLFVAQWLFRRPPGTEHWGMDHLVLARVEENLEEPAALHAAAKDVFDKAGIGLSVCSLSGALITSSGAENGCPPREELEQWMSAPRGPDEPKMVRLHHGGADVVAVMWPPERRPTKWPGILMGIALASCMVIAASFLVARSVVRPVKALSLAAQSLDVGQQPVRLEPRGPWELRALAESFNDMAKRIHGAMGSQRALLSDISHELRTPLARLRVAVELAQEGDEAQSREMLRDIQVDLQEMERIVDDVLALFRMEAHPQNALPPLRLEALDVKDVVKAAASRFTAHHPSRPLTLDVEDVALTLMGDATWLRRAVENVLDNAGKYGGDKVVTLRAKVVGGAWRVEIEDRGPGMTVQEQQGLFTPFYRVERSRSRDKGGVGLGLVLTKRIVEAHCGTLELSSVAGSGTKVVFVLPAPSA